MRMFKPNDAGPAEDGPETTEVALTERAQTIACASEAPVKDKSGISLWFSFVGFNLKLPGEEMQEKNVIT